MFPWQRRRKKRSGLSRKDKRVLDKFGKAAQKMNNAYANIAPVAHKIVDAADPEALGELTRYGGPFHVAQLALEQAVIDFKGAAIAVAEHKWSRRTQGGGAE